MNLIPAGQQRNSKRRRFWLLMGLCGVAGILSLILIAGWMDDSPKRLRSRAEAAAHAGDWNTAVKYWQEINTTKAASGLTHLGEARANLALSRAFQAESCLRRSILIDPTNPEPWRLLLEILRVEDRTLEVLKTGWSAYENVGLDARRLLLQEMTLSLLTDLPDELARMTLQRWIDADGNDIDARIALMQRMTIQPRESDPDRTSILGELETILASFPDHVVAREVLVTALADAGEPEHGRALLNEWPIRFQDARYWRLRGRWDLEYDHQPGNAVIAFRTALSELPQDWRSWYRLARALHILGREDESLTAALAVRRTRELLDPLTLGPRLDTAFNHLDAPAALGNLVDLCNRVGLVRLGEAWNTEAQAAAHASKAGPS